MVDRLKKTDSVMLVEEMEGARRATGISSTSVAAESAARADSEVLEKGHRRRFTAKYKLRVLEQADGCTEPGQIGALLRMAELERENERLRHRLVQAETIIDVQKKVSSLLGIPLRRTETD